jgi:hypothetical protein
VKPLVSVSPQPHLDRLVWIDRVLYEVLMDLHEDVGDFAEVRFTIASGRVQRRSQVTLSRLADDTRKADE